MTDSWYLVLDNFAHLHIHPAHQIRYLCQRAHRKIGQLVGIPLCQPLRVNVLPRIVQADGAPPELTGHLEILVGIVADIDIRLSRITAHQRAERLAVGLEMAERL